MGYSFQYPPYKKVSVCVKFMLCTTSGFGRIIPANANVEKTKSVWKKDYTEKERIPILWSIEINSIEELAEFSKIVQDGIIITSNEGFNVEDIAEYNIEIYDDWRE